MNRFGALTLAIVLLAALVLPNFLKGYGIYLMSMWAVLSIAAMGLNLTLGYAGQVSLAQGAFVGIGAYTAAVLSVGLLWAAVRQGWLGPDVGRGAEFCEVPHDLDGPFGDVGEHGQFERLGDADPLAARRLEQPVRRPQIVGKLLIFGIVLVDRGELGPEHPQAEHHPEGFVSVDRGAAVAAGQHL